VNAPNIISRPSDHNHHIIAALQNHIDLSRANNFVAFQNSLNFSNHFNLDRFAYASFAVKLSNLLLNIAVLNLGSAINLSISF
jgi:hypothetical protein